MKCIATVICLFVMPILSMDLPKIFTLRESTVYKTNSDEVTISKIIDLSPFPDQNEFLAIEYEGEYAARVRLRKVGYSIHSAGISFNNRELKRVACTHSKTLALLARKKDHHCDCIHLMEINNEGKFLDKATIENSFIAGLSWNPQGTLLGCYEPASDMSGQSYYIVENKKIEPPQRTMLFNVSTRKGEYVGGFAWNKDGTEYITGGSYSSHTGQYTDYENLTVHSHGLNSTEKIVNTTDIPPRNIKISNKNQCVFADQCRWANNIGLFDIENQQITTLESGKTKNINAFCFDPTGNYLATGDQQGTIVIWDTRSQAVVCTYMSLTEINALAWSEDSKELLVGFNEKRHEKHGYTLVGYTMKKIIEN